MAVYGTRGKLYFGSIADVDGTDGTLIADVQDHVIRIEMGMRSRAYRVGREPDEIKAFNVPAAYPATIKIPLRGLDNDSIDKLFFGLSSSGLIASDGFSSLAATTTAALIIRPLDTAAKYFYAKAVALHPASDVQALTYGASGPLTANNELWLVATRVAGSTERACMFGTAAELASHYAALT